MSFDYQYSMDILVAGGALTGLWAGIRAKDTDPSAEVYVADKATSGKSGCVAFAGGDISYVTPEDDLAALIDRYLKNGDGLAEAGWIEMALVESYDRVNDMVEWGLPFERDAAGRLARYGGRGGGALAVVLPGYRLLQHVRAVAEKKGVKFLDRVSIVELLRDQDGAISGAIGFNPQTDETFLLKSPNVILAAGPCSFKASYIGHRMATGDGVAMAYRHGAELMAMEFAVGHNTGPRDFDLSGLARFVSLGGKFTNAQGEEFLTRYDQELKNKANWGTLAYAMAKEAREGRGPIYFDLTDMDQQGLELSRRIIPHTFRALERSGRDITKERIEWIPCFQGSQACAGGVVVNKKFETSIPGLFATGDTGARRWYGAEAGYHGINLAWCCISGYHAGETAIRRAREVPPPAVSREAAFEALSGVFRPRSRSGGLTPTEAISGIQKTLIPPEVAIIKNEASLTQALSEIRDLAQRIENELWAPDGHELIKAVETRNMALLAEMIVTSALVRKETRGCHFRDDYPGRDDANYRRWTYLAKDEAGSMRVRFGGEQ